MLPQHLLDDVSFIDRRAFWAALMLKQQLLVIEPHQVQDRRVQVVDMDAVFNGVQAEVVCLPNHLASLHTAASQPHRKPVRIVIAAVPLL